MSNTDKYKLIAADTLARLVVYGPLAAAAVMFCPPALAVIALAASQPWLGEGIGIAATWLEKRYPRIMGPVDRILSHYAGMQWWKHAGVLITALAVAIVPTPEIFNHLPHIVQSGLGLLGGASQTWTGIVLPFALATALPFATTMATNGFEWVFQKIPALREASILRQQDRQRRRAERQATRAEIRHRVLGEATPETAPPVATLSGDVPSAGPVMPPAPGPTAMLSLRHVVAPVDQRVIRGRSRLLPDVMRLATPPRAEVPRPQQRFFGDLGL